MQVVSFKKMRMRTTRRLEIIDSRREVEPLFVAWKLLNLSTGVSSCYSVATILWKKYQADILTNVCCEKSIVSDPLTLR